MSVFFWLTTVGRYVFAALVGLITSIAISLFILRVNFGNDDSPALGLLWVIASILSASLLIPLCLGITAEFIQRKELARRFKWSKAFLRSLLALPIMVGPLYAAWVLPHVKSNRPTHWTEKEVLLCCVSALFAYLSLKIKKRPTALTVNG